MSYCRFGWDGSDVYVFDHVGGYIDCCGCWLDEEENHFDTPEEMIVHLAKHKRAGDFVPLYAIERLFREIPSPNEPVRPEPAVMTEYKRKVEEFSASKFDV